MASVSLPMVKNLHIGLSSPAVVRASTPDSPQDGFLRRKLAEKIAGRDVELGVATSGRNPTEEEVEDHKQAILELQATLLLEGKSQKERFRTDRLSPVAQSRSGLFFASAASPVTPPGRGRSSLGGLDRVEPRPASAKAPILQDSLSDVVSLRSPTADELRKAHEMQIWQLLNWEKTARKGLFEAEHTSYSYIQQMQETERDAALSQMWANFILAEAEGRAKLRKQGEADWERLLRRFNDMEAEPGTLDKELAALRLTVAKQREHIAELQTEVRSRRRQSSEPMALNWSPNAALAKISMLTGELADRDALIASLRAQITHLESRVQESLAAHDLPVDGPPESPRRPSVADGEARGEEEAEEGAETQTDGEEDEEGGLSDASFDAFEPPPPVTPSPRGMPKVPIEQVVKNDDDVIEAQLHQEISARKGKWLSRAASYGTLGGIAKCIPMIPLVVREKSPSTVLLDDVCLRDQLEQEKRGRYHRHFAKSASLDQLSTLMGSAVPPLDIRDLRTPSRGGDQEWKEQIHQEKEERRRRSLNEGECNAVLQSPSSMSSFGSGEVLEATVQMSRFVERSIQTDLSLVEKRASKTTGAVRPTFEDDDACIPQSPRGRRTSEAQQ
eukprot:Sspe_Gene.99360::Locus_72885_Transcript_2_2_Confidence_0.667_Length_2194::g.99360::m.99360